MVPVIKTNDFIKSKNIFNKIILIPRSFKIQGLDIPEIDLVITTSVGCYKDYIDIAGRTGRGHSKGTSIILTPSM
jgi:ERCC4-related helicase